MITAENIQWKEAILLVMAVEKAAELIAVDRVVGGVEIQHDPLRWHGVGLEEQLDEQFFDGTCAAANLLVPAILVGPDGSQGHRIKIPSDLGCFSMKILGAYIRCTIATTSIIIRTVPIKVWNRRKYSDQSPCLHLPIL